jgi:hypothetical protein
MQRIRDKVGAKASVATAYASKLHKRFFPVEIIVQGEMFHQPGRILGEESQGSVESDRLSTLDPLIHNDMPASPPQNHLVELYKPYRGNVRFEEVIRCLNESQPDTLSFRFLEVDAYDEAYKKSIAISS